MNSLLVEEFEIAEERLTPEANLKDDLEIDSLDLVDIVRFQTQSGRTEKRQDAAGFLRLYSIAYLMAQEWSGQTGGTHWMQRALVHWVRHTDIRIMYGVTNLWLVWYMLVRSTERHGAYVFHRRRGRTRLQAACDVYRSFYHFAKAIIDRFAVYAGKSFEVTVENSERYYDKVHDPEGFVMLFSHVGNTEMAAYFPLPADDQRQGYRPR